MNKYRNLIRRIDNFPIPGINFRDITPLMADKEAFSSTLDEMVCLTSYTDVDKFAGIDARGFIFGAAVATLAYRGFVPVRKPGKLPYTTHEVNYTLEYGTNVLQLHTDAISTDENIIIVDDVIATGGTMLAAIDLVKRAGGNVIGCLSLIELTYLDGSKQIRDMGIDVYSVFKINSNDEE